jgi:predicted small lipoprotein YifL
MRKSLYSLVLITCLTSCGQTGPLYLPQDEPAPEANAVEPAEPAKQP